MRLDFKDESLTECLNKVISGLIPHNNYNPESFALIYPTLKTVLSREDVRGLHFVFYVIFDKYFALSSSVGTENFKINITEERFSSALQNNLPDLILEPQLEIDVLMAEEGKSADITIPTVQQEVMGVIYEKLMALYSECKNIASSYDDSMSSIIDLKDIVKANLIDTSISAQRAIMSTGVRMGKKFYRGPSGWIEYTQDVTRKISELDQSSTGDLECDSIAKADEIDDRVKTLSTALCGYGIPQLDDFTPMLCHRLMVLVARENVGKTRIFIHLIASLIRAGVKPFFECGESPKELMFNNIVSSYIYQEYGMYFESNTLYGEGYEELSAEDKQIVNTAKARILSSGLVISNDLAYDDFTSKVTYYFHRGCEAFFFDHSQSLRGRRGRKTSELVTTLALDAREIKTKLPIFVAIASHPSTDVKTLFQKEQNGKTTDLQVSPTAQSSTLSTEADELFILHENEFLKRQGLLMLYVNKRRNGEKPAPIYLRTHFNVSAFEYNDKYQSVGSEGQDSLDGLIHAVTSAENISFEEEGGEDDDMIVDFD